MKLEVKFSQIDLPKEALTSVELRNLQQGIVKDGMERNAPLGSNASKQKSGRELIRINSPYWLSDGNLIKGSKFK